MRQVIHWIVTLLLAAAPRASIDVPAEGKTAATCGAPEVVVGAVEYNKLTCAGIASMKVHAYAEAARYFDKALQIPLLEQPNFKLLPRLALAQFRAGDEEAGRATLEEAELALSVLAGVVRCVEEQGGFALVYSTGLPVNSSRAGRVARRMCGAAYDGYYIRATLQSFLRDSELIRYFFTVQAELERPRH